MMHTLQRQGQRLDEHFGPGRCMTRKDHRALSMYHVLTGTMLVGLQALLRNIRLSCQAHWECSPGRDIG